MPFPFTRIPSSRHRDAEESTPHGKGEARSSQFAPVPAWHSAPARPVLDAGPDGTGAAVPLTARTMPFGASPALNNGSDTSPFAFPSLDRTAAPADPSADGPARTVSELEAEMNRLLGQIASDRRSS
jgi:hypothetical protein